MELAPLPVLAELLRRSAALKVLLADEFGKRPLVAPNSKFFPDLFEKDEPSLHRLVRRLQHHAGMNDIPVVARIVTEETAPAVSSCSTGGCGPAPAPSEFNRLEATDDGWHLNVLSQELLHPTALTCNLSRALAHVFLMETCSNPQLLDKPLAVTADLAAVQLGLGPLLLQGAYIYSKSCGGPNVTKLTALSVEELAFAVAFVASANEQRWQGVVADVDVTQAAALSEAAALVSSNADLVQRFRDTPAALLTPGAISLGEARSWLARVFSKPRQPDPDQLLEAALAGAPMEGLLPSGSPVAKKPGRAIDPELKALVEDALSRAD